MLAIAEILLPIFGLILAGFICRRKDVLGPTTASELNRFVVWLALPALLFDIMANAKWHELAQPEFIATFSLACGGAFLVILVWRLATGVALTDASIDAIAASYPNTAYVGIPLCLLAFGPDSLLPATIATILVACVLFAVAVVLIETGLQAKRSLLPTGKKVLASLARNPLIVAPIAGIVVAVSPLSLPDSVETFLQLLSAAASPCALVCLGLFLAEARPDSNSEPRSALLLSAIKLIMQPALAWWLAVKVFHLPVTLVPVTVLLAALPTGTGPFMLAEYYRREAQIASRTILFSTLGSLISLSLLLSIYHA